MIRVIRTAREGGERLSAMPALQFARSTELLHSIMVDPQVKYQEIEGFGGAFTEAAADTFRRMPPASRLRFVPGSDWSMRFGKSMNENGFH